MKVLLRFGLCFLCLIVGFAPSHGQAIGGASSGMISSSFSPTFFQATVQFPSAARTSQAPTTLNLEHAIQL
ncbi:hypothetical protein WAJ43_23860, partial [Acinetobacter baumannii]